MRRWLAWPMMVLYAVAILLGAAWYVPKLSADRFHEPIHQALEKALGRKVKIGTVKFQLLPVPGFTIRDVNIGEDPAIGAEPVAYISILRGRPRISSLFGGPLAFASVDLEETSLNLTRVDRGEENIRWNFSSIVNSRGNAGASLASFPTVHLISGRVNFKFGDTKSVFYLLNTDVDLWPPASIDDPWTLKIRAEPARTDRPARGFGSFVARGQWQPRRSAVTLDVRLEKSQLSDLLTFFEGRESSIHGIVSGNVHLAGPLWKIGVAGQVDLGDIHGWNQPPPGGNSWPLTLSGVIDAPGQIVDLRAVTSGRQTPVDVRYRVTNYLGQPRWGVTALFSQLPLGPLAGLARNLGLGIPEDLTLNGAADGAVGYSTAAGLPRMDGNVRITDSTIAVSGAPQLKMTNAGLQFSGSVISLTPVVLTDESQATATVSGAFDIGTQELDISLVSDGMAIESLRRHVSVAKVPLLSEATAGKWSGNLRYSSLQPAWTGEVHLTDADVPFEAFAQPLHILAADALLSAKGAATRKLTFSLGAIQGDGEYRYEIGTARPHRFQLSIAKADGSELEKLLMPALHRGNFLNYAFNFGRAPEPDWMRSMHAEGTIRFEEIDLAGQAFHQVRARVQWDGPDVRITGLSAQLPEGLLAGMGGINLTQLQPRYALEGKINGVLWRSGQLDAEGSLQTFGTGDELLSNLKAEGKFRGRDFDPASLNGYSSVEGGFDWAQDGKTPRLKLSQLTLSGDSGTLQGSAETLRDGQLVLRATDGTRQIQAQGAVLQGEALKPVTP